MKKMSKRKKKNASVSGITAFIFLIIVILLPLYMENKYYNIVDAKAHALSVILGFAWFLMLSSVGLSRADCLDRSKPDALDLSVIAFGLVAVISCLFSGEFTNAFFGSYGWGIGGFVIFSLTALYLFVSRTIRVGKNMLIPAAVVATFAAVLTVLHSMNVDLFSMHLGIDEKQTYLFKSTLGNLNAHSGYVCLLFPVILILFIKESDRKALIWEGIGATALLAEAVFGCTDSVYLGIGLCAFFAVPYVCRSTQRVRRVCLLIIVYGLLLLCAGQLECFADSTKALGGLAQRMCSLRISLVITAVGALAYLLLRFCPNALDKPCIRKALIALLELLLLSTAAYFAVDMLQNFSDSWGTNRGKIWRLSLEEYRNLPLGKKLFGIGPEMQQTVLTEAWKRKLPVYTCHSEPIQILLTMGISGLACWATAYGTVIVRAVRDKIWRFDRMIYVLPIIAYLGQSFVNSAVATNVGILCLALACYRCSDKAITMKEKNNNNTNKIRRNS